MSNIYIVCPVRGVTEFQHELIEKYIHKLEEQGHTVYWPEIDTEQNAGTFSICSNNQTAIEMSDEVHVYFEPTSEGSIFDLAMMAVANLDDHKRSYKLINEDSIANFSSLMRTIHSMANSFIKDDDFIKRHKQTEWSGNPTLEQIILAGFCFLTEKYWVLFEDIKSKITPTSHKSLANLILLMTSPEKYFVLP